MHMKLTNHRVENLKAPAIADLLVWDESLAGFGLRVGKRRRTWLVQYRDRTGRSRRMKLGRWPTLSLAAARAKWAEALAAVECGEDPAAEGSERCQTPTLAAFAERYRAEGHPLREVTPLHRNGPSAAPTAASDPRAC